MSNEDGTIEENLQQTNLNGDNREGEAQPAENSVPQQTDHHSLESQPESQPESDRRRHQRGGRKAKVSDNHKPWSERNGRLEQQPEFDSNSEEADPRATTTQGSKCATCGKSTGNSSDTGIKAFNLKRAEETGGRAPFGVRVDRSREEKATKEKKKKDTGKKKKKKKKQQQESSDEDSEESDDEEPEKRKPVAIRLDLNLELEIFLRAKVKGDVTITFLE